MAEHDNVYGGRGPGFLALSWTLSMVANVLIGLRAYVYLRIKLNGGWALFWVVFANIVLLVSLCISTVATTYGAGNHFGLLLKAGTVDLYFFWMYLCNAIFLVGIAFSKVAAASFLLAVLQDTGRRSTRIFLHFMAWTNVLIVVPNLIMLFLQCDPPNKLWQPEVAGHCKIRPALHYTYFQASWGAASDFAMAVLPISIVIPLQMPARLKLILCSVMSLGIVACACACMRTYFLKSIDTDDPSFTTIELYYWGSAEGWLTIIAASVPPTWPFFKPYLHKIASVTSSLRRKSDLRSDRVRRAEEGVGDDGDTVALSGLNGGTEGKSGPQKGYQFLAGTSPSLWSPAVSISGNGKGVH